ncbi:AraC family transcriptional regulator [Vibrio crassostreae]|nr:AraC family transcriptional regulator [Vibrio crassostreae]CAK2497743.1 AraC family transcriptional regulator [Vibrio crassostreae]CAK2499410.1 AraC family transcriptional regulator [Vibrio crassostreae]CAK3298903.1 AraC family transcriptional regulator [Vibrio crassostreae]CAK3802296.1 AraC family transcriptional regulator [Vibrio crassostreae]
MTDVPFKVIDPNELPNIYRVAFEQFLAGSCAPYPIYAYQHDYERFLLLIEQGEITIEK